MDAAIRIEGLVKSYADVVAVDGLDLEVRRGECFGLLGPNGAGKTTTVEILEGLTAPTSGTVEVLGRRWDRARRRAARAHRRRAAGDASSSTGSPSRRRCASSGPSTRGARARVETLLEEMQLEEKRATWVMKLSGGQRQRLAVALGLVGDPEVLFLDEPTTGLDPQSRRALWDTIAALRARGKTVVLTTHYMDEAERLCDRVAIVDHGKLIALGTPSELIDRHRRPPPGRARDRPAAAAPRRSRACAGCARVARRTATALALSIDEPHVALPALIARLAERGARPTRLVSRTATLDDVFLSLTGRTLRED